MISALIISIAVAIISMVFFIDARSTIAKLKQEADARDILTLGKVSNDPEKEEQRGTVDSQDGWALTPELVADAIKFCGYVPDVRENLVAFKVQGDDFYVRTDNLPMVCLTTAYRIPEDQDILFLKEAAEEITSSVYIGKVYVDEEREALVFQSDAYEPTYGHFRDSLECYMDVILSVRAEMARRLETRDEEYTRHETIPVTIQKIYS